MTLTRWSPVSGLPALEINRLNRMFEAAFANDPWTSTAWAPPVDIVETAAKDVVVKVDLPEVKRDDIRITFENGVLTIEGQRAERETAEGERYHRLERRAGAFRRSFTVPDTVDPDRVSASYQDGVLTVALPRRDEARPRQIPVNG
jgi:HSP20 family protein